jgi:hypothetical protein
MIASISEFERRLHALDTEDVAFVVLSDQLIEELDPSLHEHVFNAIFRFFESRPDADCGAPGTLVHHVEHFYPNYVDSLIGSVDRKPSYNGVLMIHRILNSDVDISLRNRLLPALVRASTSERSTVRVRDLAAEFLKLHS